MNLSHTPVFSEIVRLLRDDQLPQNIALISKAIQEDINNVQSLFQLALACAQSGRLEDAFTIFTCMESHSIDDFRIPYNLGLLHALRGEQDDAINAYDRALKIQPADLDSAINKAAACNEMNQFGEALKVLDSVIERSAKHKEAWLNKGIAHNHLKAYNLALESYQKALDLDPAYFEAWLNRVLPLNSMELYQEALVSCETASALRPQDSQAWFNHGNTLHLLGDDERALTSYNRALELQSGDPKIWLNKGVALNDLRRYEQALAHYDKVLVLLPKSADAYLNKGVSLCGLRRYGEALNSYNNALECDPQSALAWANKAITLNELKQYEDALICYENALSINPDIHWILGDRLHIKMKMCKWNDFNLEIEKLIADIHSHKKASQPFLLLSLVDDPSIHRKCASLLLQGKQSIEDAQKVVSVHPKHKKIRLGYFSADFHNHATSHLMAELFELHDHNKYELFAFSFGPPTNDLMHSRLRQSFDHFLEIENLSDVEIAQLARSKEIDIAIDLKGYTQDSRSGIFSYRAAPIQVNYLGYPGTLSADYIDYLIADHSIVSAKELEAYSEKLVFLPHSYQVNDRSREISKDLMTREECGLPENSFVFACFNNNYKILPDTFDRWMRILGAVEASVLWLFEDNEFASKNLKIEAEKRGINPGRLVFAKHLPLSRHLARHQYADLFLDTYPYNAHTTASDALWAGLPVLTMMGKSFASRVAASLLNAIGLPELITNSPESYEARAIELAQDPEQLASIREKLAKNRLTEPLFDTPLFTKNLESAYLMMYERYQAGLEPDHLVV